MPFPPSSQPRKSSNSSGKKSLDRDTTYSHQLNIVVPLIARLQKIALLPDTIRGLLNRLRDLRNKVAHTGALPTPLTKEEVAELIVAATFGFHYGRFFRGKLTLSSS